MKKLKLLGSSQPNAFAIVSALLLALFLYALMAILAGGFDKIDASGPMRVIFIAALLLLMQDVLVGAQIALEKRRDFRIRHFWIYAFYFGYFYCVSIVLFFWDGVESAPRLLIQWGLSGTMFGIAMAVWTKPFSQTDEHLKDRFDLENPMTGRPFGFLYNIWPIVLIFLIVGLIAYPPTSGWSDKYPLFQFVLFGSLMPLYGYRTDHFWRNFAPRMVGLALLLIGLLAF